ncbi:MAG: Gfo/Idh/MocA family oxidoreductase [Betaproteobacteria bacterium]|nr:Gfo/Idh/MocA family oxidoreductase [Betaproteobacteria bacterium]
MLNAAIVGMGRWGQNLVQSVHGKSDAIRFVAGWNRTPDKVREFALGHGVELFDTYAALLRDDRIDAVVLATPHADHGDKIIAAATAGKHVFCEKPLTLDAQSARRAIEACTRHGVTLAVGYNWRFQPALQRIKAMLDDGTLGTLLHIEGNFCGPSVYRFDSQHWRNDPDQGPAGGMTGRGVHLVDAMLYLSGQVESVYAQSARRVMALGLDDTTSMLFKFRGGSSGYLATVIATAETWRMQVFGSKGWAEVGDAEHLTTWTLRTNFIDQSNLFKPMRPQTTQFAAMSTERAELEYFACAAILRRAIAVIGGDEQHGVAVFEAIIESAARGGSCIVR